MKTSRNSHRHTRLDAAKANILRVCDHNQSVGAVKSALGYAAFPEYKFKAPQGAAFAVAKIVSDMLRDHLLMRGHGGYLITTKGREWLDGFDKLNLSDV